MINQNIFHSQLSVFKSACYQLYTLVLGATVNRLQISDLYSLYIRRRAACMELFNDIRDNSDHKTFSLLPPRHIPNYNFSDQEILFILA